MAPHVITLPNWFIGLRGFQLLFALVVLGISADGVSFIPFNSWGIAIFTSLMTIIIVLYDELTSRLASCQAAYNYWAVVALEAFSIIFWLSSMAALAATRATFTIPLVKRQFIFEASNGYLDMMSAAAGISGLELILFIATLIVFAINLKSQRAYASPEAATTNDKTESHPMNVQSYDHPQQQQQQQQQQYTQQYPQQYPQQPQQYGQPPQQADQLYQEVPV